MDIEKNNLVYKVNKCERWQQSKSDHERLVLGDGDGGVQSKNGFEGSMESNEELKSEEKIIEVEKKKDFKEDFKNEVLEGVISGKTDVRVPAYADEEGCHGRLNECLKKQMGIIIKKLNFHRHQIERQLNSCDAVDLFNSFLVRSNDRDLSFNNDNEFLTYFTEIAILNGRLDCLQFYFSGKNGSYSENILSTNDTEVKNYKCGEEFVNSDKIQKFKNKKIKDDIDLDEIKIDQTIINEENDDYDDISINSENRNKEKEFNTNPFKIIEKIPIKMKNEFENISNLANIDSPKLPNKQKHLNMRSSSNIRSSVNQNNKISHNYGYGYNEKGSLFHSTGSGGGKGSFSLFVWLLFFMPYRLFYVSHVEDRFFNTPHL
jgi:hypothetical protein